MTTRVYTLQEAATFLNKSTKTISRYIKAGKVKPVKVKSKNGTLEYRFTEDSLTKIKKLLHDVYEEIKNEYSDKKRQRHRYAKTIQKLYENKCAICGYDKQGLQIHHITPVAAGGSDEFDNLILLCRNHHTEFHAGLLTKEEILKYRKNKSVLDKNNNDEIISLLLEKNKDLYDRVGELYTQLIQTQKLNLEFQKMYTNDLKNRLKDNHLTFQ